MSTSTPEHPPRPDFDWCSFAFWFAILAVAMLAVSMTIVRSNFLLFHALAEIFSITVAWAVFFLVWNARRFIRNEALVLLGIAFFFIGLIDLLHTLAYRGMGVFPGPDTANLATQLWLAGRFMQAVTMLVFALCLRRSLELPKVVAAYSVATLALLASIFVWNVFPDCYVEGSGLTPFKIASEYIVIAILLSSFIPFWRNRSYFDTRVFGYLAFSIILTIMAEFSFTHYVGVFDMANVVGHLFKIASFMAIYLALIRSGLTRPYELIFKELKDSEDFLNTTGHMAKVGGWEIDLKTNSVTWTKATKELFEVPADFLPTVDEAIAFFPGESGDRIDEAVGRAQEQGVPYDLELEFRTAKGNFRQVRTIGRPLMKMGKCVRLSGTIQDITEHKQMQREHGKLEEQLRQSQKMEAVGRLAGGIAHDFNNVLTAIQGYSDMVLLELPDDHPAFEDVQGIVKASENAANLIDQLLAFSRRQVIQPRVLNLNEVVGAALGMLRRIISGDIAIQFHPAADLWTVKVDPDQIVRILINLVINSRDAMPGGGVIALTTENVVLEGLPDGESADQPSPGEYARIAIADTGFGIEPADQSMVFEPFFTTKGRGKGTGLGLSTVYGIVRQNDGRIALESTPAHGTTVFVDLPRCDGEPSVEPSPTYSANLGGTETILVVDDEPTILPLAERALVAQGYRVLTATNGFEAIKRITQIDEPIDLLITDVVMPKMSGKELHDRAKALRPKLAVLFISGYSEDVIARQGVLEDDMQFLQKPFRPRALVARVRGVLDARVKSPV
jgi:PAS domain S-box-containing protein